MDMSGHDMSGADGAECKISMLWNWYTVDTCFLSSSWQNKTKAQFAGTVIGVFLWVMATEGVRRLGRDYDRRLLAAYNAAKAQAKCGCGDDGSSKDGAEIDASAEAGGFVAMKCRPKIPQIPTWSQQTVRGAIYGTSYTSAFLIMLLGMYYNGFVLFAIFLGGFAGYVVFGSDTIAAPEAMAKNESPCCC